MALTKENILMGICCADHMGDVNNYIPNLADALGIERPRWSDEYNRYIFKWEIDEINEELEADGEEGLVWDEMGEY